MRNLLKETGAGGDFKVDATLQKACKEPARKLCPEAKNDMGVLSCLMENFESKDLAGACHEQLLHLQFFMARDFQLDESAYQACHSDADKLCKNPHFGNEDKEIAPQAMTLSCLYRHMLPNMNPDPTQKVSSECVAVVMKTMHQRAADVRLMPQVQLRCITDLAKYCSENVEESDELKCLQDNMEKLSDTCKESMETLTEEESEDIDLDKSLVKHCSEMVKFFCSDLLKRNDADGILPCLYNNKYDHEMDDKCRAELEHKQLIEMKDYRFSSKFKKACRQDVQDNCNTAKSKADVIKCLSLKVRSAVVDGEKHTISGECRKQLNVEKLRQAEDIKFDPELYGACADDVKKLCIHKHENGPAAVLECLKEFQDQLSDDCSRRIFEREKKEVSNPKLDVRLFKVCKPLIKKFCKDVSPNKILHCLEEHKRDMGDYEECREMVFTRQKNALKDIELMPGLAKACHKDIKDFCHEVTHNDQIIPCLKKNIKKLSSNCEEFVVNLEKEAALDYRLNPSLAKACADEIEAHCSDINPGHGEIMECLRNNYQDIKNTKCRAEIKEALIEERTDIMADPLLHETCFRAATRFCHEISHGRGRILQCLLDALEKGQINKGECKTMLKSRKEMWSGFQLPPPESFIELAAVINTSPQRNYFFIVFSCVLAIIFVGGLVSGRLTKRVAREVKNR
ncbi:Golgi apparatus protein 1-like isoform X2 [Xenia sp. Carnegie-2017]|uniref:Golgi apparatus protein 1-like isoform X2 n=1 Tax=Xenia sp. Carnegie-2017 TaxID=2897299 RepID=UPI001F03B6CD|nr:Golgi apparatus protein 1-like isoform X2 [Xenia sp. Carnegie-2017]